VSLPKTYFLTLFLSFFPSCPYGIMSWSSFSCQVCADIFCLTFLFTKTVLQDCFNWRPYLHLHFYIKAIICPLISLPHILHIVLKFPTIAFVPSPRLEMPRFPEHSTVHGCPLCHSGDFQLYLRCRRCLCRADAVFHLVPWQTVLVIFMHLCSVEYWICPS
jgi:hypothetical protein